MTKRQRILVYSITLFIMIWGLDIINALKLNEALRFWKLFNPLYFSQLIYAGATLLLTHIVCSRLFLLKKYWKFGFSIVCLLIFFILLRYCIEEVLYPVLVGARNYSQQASLLFYFLDNVYYALVYVALGFLLFLLDMQLGNQKKQAMLMQQNKEAELQFLRSLVALLFSVTPRHAPQLQ